jgi:topoisomerase-4 subunit A
MSDVWSRAAPLSRRYTQALHYVPKPRLKILSEEFKAQSFGVKGIKAGGVRLSGKAVKRIAVKTKQ